jgi:hypothetical protein
VNFGAPSNACQPQDRRPKVPGQDPCPLLEKQGGIWKFDENKLGQTADAGTRYATGMRQMPAIAWHDGALYMAMNGRDQLDTLWPDLFKAEDNVQRPSETLYRVTPNMNVGWPYCFHDFVQNKLLLNPEYGGDGKTVGRCSEYPMPVATFPPHSAPVDLMFYTGAQFPKRYQGGAFIAFHGSWNRSPMPQDGYNVTFQAFAGDKASGKPEIFADGFAGKNPIMQQNDAAARADGVAQAPDQHRESVKGKIWRSSTRKITSRLVRFGVAPHHLRCGHRHRQAGATNGEWRTYGGDLGHTRYAPLTRSTRRTSTAEVAWRFIDTQSTPNSSWRGWSAVSSTDCGHQVPWSRSMRRPANFAGCTARSRAHAELKRRASSRGAASRTGRTAVSHASCTSLRATASSPSMRRRASSFPGLASTGSWISRKTTTRRSI